MSTTDSPASVGSATPTGSGQDTSRSRRSYRSLIVVTGLFAASAGLLWYWHQPDSWRYSAAQAISAGQFDKARGFLARIVERLPEDGESRLKFAQLLDIGGETDAAVTNLYRLPEDMLGREDVLINLGRMLISLNRATEAETRLRHCVKGYPNSVRARQLLLDIYRWEHREDEAQALRTELFVLARGMSEADQLWVMLRSFIEEYTKVEDQENWAQLVRWWETNKEDAAVRIAMACHLLLQGDRVQEAAADLEALLPHCPDSVAAITLLLEYYLHIEGRSLERSEQLIDRWPVPYRFHTYWFYQGQILEQKDQEADAIAAYRRALSMRPDHLASLQAISTLLTRSGKASENSAWIEEGATLAKQLVEATKTQSEAQELLGRILQWLKEWDEAMRGQTTPPEAAIVQDVAQFYARLGRHAEAQQWRDILLKLGQKTYGPDTPSKLQPQASGRPRAKKSE